MIQKLNTVGKEIAKNFGYEGSEVKGYVKYGSGREYVTTNNFSDGHYELQVGSKDWSCSLRYSIDGKLALCLSTGVDGLNRAFRINRRILEV